MASPSSTTAVITTLAECLDDLTVRFLLNLPASELSSVPRLCFQVEEAQWFYEDFIRPAALAATGIPLPSLPLRQFCLQLFQHSPLLSGFTDAQHIAAYEEFLAYKVRVPVRGAILLDESMEKLVLVKGWKKGASWSFPRGKINKDEKDLDCAIREVYEETGYDLRAANLIPATESEAKYIDVTMREQHMRLFVFRGVSEETYFEPQTRKEISKIAWYQVRDLPGFTKKVKGGAEQAQHVAGKFYMVAPFLGPLKKWIQQQRRRDEEMEVRGLVQGPAVTRQGVRDEMVKTQEPVDKEGAVDQSAELKRLLSRGGLADSVVQPAAPATTDGGASSSLLSLLRGGPSNATSNVPQTPFEHVSTFPLQPETPQPHHSRHPSAGYQQHSVPHFPIRRGSSAATAAQLLCAEPRYFWAKSYWLRARPTRTRARPPTARPAASTKTKYARRPSHHARISTKRQPKWRIVQRTSKAVHTFATPVPNPEYATSDGTVSATPTIELPTLIRCIHGTPGNEPHCGTVRAQGCEPTDAKSKCTVVATA